MVVPAHVQGLVKNLEYYRCRAVGACKNDHPPMVFQEGSRVKFHVAVERLCPKKLKKVRNTGNGEDLTTPSSTKAPQERQQPDTNAVQSYATPQHANIKPPPGLERVRDCDSLDGLNNDCMSILHDARMAILQRRCMTFGAPLPREPCMDLDDLAKLCRNRVVEPIRDKEKEQLPMKVVPQFCSTRQEELLSASLLFEDDAIQANSDDISSTTASEDDRAMDFSSMWQPMYGYEVRPKVSKGSL